MRTLRILCCLLAIGLAGAGPNTLAQEPGKPQAAASEPAPMNEADALAIAALEGLFAAPPERALPLLKKVLTGNRSEEVKARALFVLAQIDDPAANQLLVDSARSGSPRLRTEAIRAIGIRGDQASLALLHEFARSDDASVRQAVTQAMIIAGDKAGLFELAKSAKSDEAARQAIDALAAIGARDELRALSKSGVDTRNLITAMAISGDLEGLLAIAQSSNEADLRVQAIQQIGIVQDAEVGATLGRIYVDAKDDATRDAALQGLGISGDEQALLALYRQERDAGRKRQILRAITIFGGDAAFDAIESALEGKSP